MLETRSVRGQCPGGGSGAQPITYATAIGATPVGEDLGTGRLVADCYLALREAADRLARGEKVDPRTARRFTSELASLRAIWSAQAFDPEPEELVGALSHRRTFSVAAQK